MKKVKILISGATGFVGKPLIKALKNSFYDIFPVVRNTSKSISETNDVVVSGIDSNTDWKNYLDEINTVIHCAARVHVMKETTSDPLEDFREVNVLGAMNLAKSAVKAGVKRFVFISSIKVNGASTTGTVPYLPSDKPVPEDPYGISKAEAEEQLLVLGKKTGMEVVIIRPPLVYGPGVKANFAMMLKLASFGIPLPFGRIVDNRRSMVYVENLVDLIVKCISHPNAANQTFLVSDDDDLSTARMVKELSTAMGGKGWSLPIPPKIFEIAGRITGKSEVVERLCGSLQVDITKTKELLNWGPPFTVKEGFANTVKHFLQNK
tara:strand:- start:745 stop:1707 length:963 start_codon:yes stop_codon:yes gene_type:complete